MSKPTASWNAAKKACQWSVSSVDPGGKLICKVRFKLGPLAGDAANVAPAALAAPAASAASPSAAILVPGEVVHPSVQTRFRYDDVTLLSGLNLEATGTDIGAAASVSRSCTVKSLVR
jgi:hypothetical protein